MQHGGGGTARAAQLWPFHRARGGGAAGGGHKKRVLVLMSDTGGGHRASAQAYVFLVLSSFGLCCSGVCACHEP